MAVLIRGKKLSCCGTSSASARTAIGSLPCPLRNERRAMTVVQTPAKILNRVWTSFCSARSARHLTVNAAFAAHDGWRRSRQRVGGVTIRWAQFDPILGYRSRGQALELLSHKTQAISICYV